MDTVWIFWRFQLSKLARVLRPKRLSSNRGERRQPRTLARYSDSIRRPKISHNTQRGRHNACPFFFCHLPLLPWSCRSLPLAPFGADFPTPFEPLYDPNSVLILTAQIERIARPDRIPRTDDLSADTRPGRSPQSWARWENRRCSGTDRAICSGPKFQEEV